LSGVDLPGLAEEQAALRRVATLVARGNPEEVFAAVTEEVGRVLLVDVAALSRYESDYTMTNLAIWHASGGTFPAVGRRHPLGGQNTSTLVFETGRSARIDAYPGASDSIATVISAVGVRSSVGAPISVEGRLWGVIHAASTREQPLSADAETRLASFTELVATAIANAESRVALARLVEEQAALRRVATLVARGAPPEQVFASVTEEVGQLLYAEYAGLNRYEADGTTTIVAVWAGPASRSLLAAAGSCLVGGTSPRSSSRRVVPPGSTVMAIPPGRLVSQPARPGWAQAWGRRSSSRGACGAR
jgi:GAF domain-containing protein